jgi:hypothetical protein
MNVLHGVITRLNITFWMIHKNLECHEDHTNQLMEQGDVVLQDGEDK